MLILHPSSRCDVCLDAYTWQTIAQTPHAIPCGHVFCRPCLFALTPHLCPLCRKKFDPSKAKKLHVDRPEYVDENRENDLLQRMALSSEAPEDQLQELIHEVDTWLETRADDTCIVLRKARATLARYLKLKETETTLENVITETNTRFNLMTFTYETKHREALATETKLRADNEALIRENENLKAEVKELRTASEQYSYRKNPLPPPPNPVSTEYVPSFTQAMATHDRAMFDLSSSPIASPYARSFEVEGRRRQKGKAKLVDHRLFSPTSPNPPLPLPTQQAKMDPSEEGPTLVSHFDHHGPHQRQNSTPAPSSGLQLHFDNTSQPLDVFELTQTYLREYSQGVLDGQLMAGKPASRSSTSQQSHASTSSSRSDVSLHDSNESVDARSIRSNRSTQSRGIQPVSGPSTVDRSSLSIHQRQNTVSSIGTSVESSSTGRSRSRSRSISLRNPISRPTLAEILSDSLPTPPRRPVTSLPTSPPNPSQNSVPSLSLSSLGQQQPEPSIHSNLARVDSPASQVSKASYSSWGTIISTSTNHTTYSLLGLRDFREGSYPRTALGPDGASNWPSPVSSTAAVVGVNNAASPRSRGRNGSRINPQRLPQYPPPPSMSSWHGSVASLSPQDQSSFSNGYHPDDENENVARRSDEFLNLSYSRDTAGSRPRTMEPQRMTRGRNQPLPAVSPSFVYGHSEAIIVEEEDNRLGQNLMETFGNALGLELTTGPIPISAPTPVVPHRTFLRSFSDET